MELQQTVVELNFQNLFHSGRSLRTFKISTFFHHGKYKKKLHILIGAHFIKQLKAGCPACEIQGKVFFIIKYMCIFIPHENIK